MLAGRLEPLKRIRIAVPVLCATTIALSVGASTSRAAGPIPLSQIPPRAYVVATYNGSILRLYVNGAPAAQTPVTGFVERTDSPLEIGSYEGQAIWSGAIQEVAVYDRALPEATIAAHYRLGINPHPPAPNAYRSAVLAASGLVSYWRLGDLGAVAMDSRGHNSGAFTPGVVKGAPGLITDEAGKSILLNGELGSVRVPPSPSLDLRRAFTLEAWVTTVNVANRHIVSRVGSWFLKTDALGRWSAGVYVNGALHAADSTIVAHGPRLPRAARRARTHDNSSFSPLWVLIPVAIAVVVVLLRRRARSSRH